jgi:putative alpha-1,2-mannosidase
MSGDPVVPMIADGYCRGLLDDDLAAALYDESVALRSHRPKELDELGFLPGKPGTTLEYGVADFALALMADGLGRTEEADRKRPTAGPRPRSTTATSSTRTAGSIRATPTAAGTSRS